MLLPPARLALPAWLGWQRPRCRGHLQHQLLRVAAQAAATSCDAQAAATSCDAQAAATSCDAQAAATSCDAQAAATSCDAQARGHLM